MALPSHPGTTPLLQSTYFIHFYINEAKMNWNPNESWSDSIDEHLLSSPHVHMYCHHSGRHKTVKCVIYFADYSVLALFLSKV